MPTQHRIVVIGGGFGGLQAARALKSAPGSLSTAPSSSTTANEFDRWVRPDDMVHPLR